MIMRQFHPSSRFSIATVAIIFMMLQLEVVVGDESYAVRTLLNHGYSLPTGQTCTSIEWDSITDAMDNAASRRRRKQRLLRGSSDGGVDLEQQQNHHNHHRELGSPYYCTTMCQAFAPGTCYLVYPACKNRRRYRNLSSDNEAEQEELQQDAAQEDETTNKELKQEKQKQHKEQQRELGGSSSSTSRVLVTNAICQMKIGAINTALDDLLPTLSTDCQAVVGSTRDFECYEIHTITGWNLWDADLDTITIPSFPELGSICRTINFNIEAIIPDDDMITSVHFIVSGPNGYSKIHIEDQNKWFMFGNNGNNVFGEILSVPGTYTVTAKPNNDPTMERSLSFNVVDC